MNKFYLHIVFFFIFLFAIQSYAQNTILPTQQINTSGIRFKFHKEIVEFSKGEMISNVLAVTNTKDKPIKFFVDISIPSEWKVVSKQKKLYELASGDSLFIPIHILPKVNLRGSTRFLFTAYVYGESNEPYGYTYFYGLIKKQIGWSLTTDQTKIYLKNGQTSAPFIVAIMNTSSEEQDIHFTLQSISKNTAIFDSSGEKNAQIPVTFRLASQDDTLFHYTFKKQIEPRNYRLIDVEGYNPYSVGQASKFSILANSTSPNAGDKNKFRAGQKIDFVQLSDKWEVNPYGTDVIPIVFDMNAYNVLGNNPMLNISLRGQTFFNETSSLVYNTQFTYMTNIFTTNPYENANIYLGYFHSKFNVQVGNVNGGVLGTYQNGQGIKAEYYIDEKQRLGAFFTTSPRLFYKDPKYTSAGLYHNFQNKIFRINTQFGHSRNNDQKIFTDILNVNASTNIIKNHSFGIRGGISRNVQEDSTIVKYGFMAGAFYSGRYLHNKMNSHLSALYTSPDFGFFKFERLTANAGNEYKLNEKWNIHLTNNLYRYPQVQPSLYGDKVNYQLNNQLNFNRVNSQIGNFSPFAFYNFTRMQNFRVHSRGLGLNLGKYNLAENYRYFINLRSGYNHALDTLSKEFFFLQFSGFIQIRTVSFMTRYNLGNYSVSRNNFLQNSIKNPQNISFTLRHQYVFPRPAFVMQNAGSFSYSTLSGKSINFNPELYCYTKHGWRFRVFAEINFSIGSKSDASVHYYITSNDEVAEPEWSKSFYLGAGVRKEFGIPIPKTKKKYCTSNFIAFYDINGNGKREHNEDLLENVVIKVDAWEVITNKKGEATLSNVPTGAYLYNVFSITDLNGWFPHINDTLYLSTSGTVNVPFARGVKITGKVFLDREKIGADAEKQLDLSRIKISAVNDRTFNTLTDYDGSFEMYIPMGKYILTMDEKVLGERFQLLQNNFELIIDDKFDNLFIPFYVIEKRRKVNVTKFDNSGNRINNPVIENPPPVNNPVIEQPKPEINQPTIQDPVIEDKPIEEPKVNNNDNYDYSNMSDYKELDSLINILLSDIKAPLSNEDMAKIAGSKIKSNDLTKYGDKVVYSIQVGAFKKGDLPRELLAELVKIGKVESFKDDKGVTKFFIGNYDSLASATIAKQELLDMDLKDVFVIGIYKGKIITSKEAYKLNGNL